MAGLNGHGEGGRNGALPSPDILEGERIEPVSAGSMIASADVVRVLGPVLESLGAKIEALIALVHSTKHGESGDGVGRIVDEIHEALVLINDNQVTVHEATKDLQRYVTEFGAAQLNSFTAIIEKLDQLASTVQTVQQKHGEVSATPQSAVDIAPVLAEVTTHIARLFEEQNKALVAQLVAMRPDTSHATQQAALVRDVVEGTTKNATLLVQLAEKVAAIDSRFAASARDGHRFMLVQQSIQKQLEALTAVLDNKEEFASLQTQISSAKASMEALIRAHEATLKRLESGMGVVTEDYRREISGLRAEVARLTSQIAALDAHDVEQRAIWAAQLDAATIKLAQVEESAREQVTALAAAHKEEVAAVAAIHATALKQGRRDERERVLDVKRRWDARHEMHQKNELHKEMQKWGEMLKGNMGTILDSYAAGNVPDVRDALAYAVYVEEFVRGKPRLGTELLDVCRLVRVQLRDMRDALHGLVPYEKAAPSTTLYERMQELFVVAKTRKEDFDRLHDAYEAARKQAEREAQARMVAEEKAAAEAARAAQVEEEKSEADAKAAEAARQAQIAAEAADAERVARLETVIQQRDHWRRETHNEIAQQMNRAHKILEIIAPFNLSYAPTLPAQSTQVSMELYKEVYIRVDELLGKIARDASFSEKFREVVEEKTHPDFVQEHRDLLRYESIYLDLDKQVQDLQKGDNA